ncbi:MAG TPA: hypothetical protein VNE60_07910, partial [Gemmatimonadaceae bacterium]|nr:hypothetical protein [Gemmatimonadaceae bacterium]
MKHFIKSRFVQALAPRARLARVVAVLAVAGLFTAACDVHGVSNPGTLASMTVTPNPQVLAVNGTQQFTALGTDFSGVNVGITPTWTVVAGGGTISSSGLFTAAALAGTYTNTIKATSGSLSATAT